MTKRRTTKVLITSLIGLGVVFTNTAISQTIQKGIPPSDSFTYYRNALATRYRMGVSAHRGNSQIAPENTLSTYREVLKMQVAYIEIDVRTTNDGQLVILHDATLNRTTTGTGPLKNQSLEALKNLSAGKEFGDRFQTERIPTLNEVCQLISRWNATHPTPTNLYVDCKDVAPQPLADILERYGLLENAVFYGSDATLLALKKVAPTARLMPSLSKAEEMPDKIRKLHPYAFDLNWQEINETLVQQIHQQGIKVFSDLLNAADSADQYRKAARFKIDIIQTDYVLTVYQTLNSNLD